MAQAGRETGAAPARRPADPPLSGDRRRRERRRRDERLVAVSAILAAGGPSIKFQPLMSLTRLEVAGYEALARFPPPAAGERRRTARPGGTEEWLAVGRDVGLGPQVEAAALARAVTLGADRPAGTVLAVNLSPSSLDTPDVEAALPDDLTGLEIELTENEAVGDPPVLRRKVDALRERGALIAVDDVGAGYAGLRRVMDLAPDTVKLDRHLVDGVATNGATAALVRAVVHLADHIGARVCAEGVETAEDLVALAELDVTRAQGFFVGRPAATPGGVEPAAVEACRRSLDRLFTGPPASAPSTVTDLVGRLTDVRDLAALEAVAASCAGVLGCSRVVLGRIGPDARLSPLGVARTDDLTLLALADGDPAVRSRLAEGVVVPVYPGPDRPALGAALLVPVRSRADAVGVLACTLEDGAPWTRRQISAARLVATVLGPVLDVLTTG
ncbi:MAG: EAL domain-containing protein [Kineosporiaceae bacterium]